MKPYLKFSDKKQQNISTFGSYVLLFLPVLIYVWVVNRFAVDLFFADDFHLFKTIVWSQETPFFTEKFKLFFQQHNEHRIIFPRLLAYLDYLIEGHINWRTLIGLGTLAWLMVGWFLWKMFRFSRLSPWFFLPVPLILFQAQYYDNLTWSLSILQQSLIVFWYCLIIRLLYQKKYALAVIFAVVATFTHGNGLFVFVMSLVLLFLQKNWQQAALWALVLCLVATLYFYGFEKGQNSNIAQSLAKPLQLLSGFFAFWGSIMAIFTSKIIFSVLFGGGLFVGISIYVFGIIYKINTKPLDYFSFQVIGLYLFVSITAALVSLSRSWAGIENIVSPRYEHYSPLMLCLGYLILLKRGLMAASPQTPLQFERGLMAASPQTPLQFERGLMAASPQTPLQFERGLMASPQTPLQYERGLMVASPQTPLQFERGLMVLFIGFGIVFSGLSYFQNVSELANRKANLQADALNWQQHQVFLNYPISFNNNIKTVVQKADSQGVCEFNTLEILPKITSLDSSIVLDIQTFKTYEKDASGQFERKYFTIENNDIGKAKQLFLQLNTDRYYFALQQHKNSKKGFLTSLNYYRAGFKAFVLTECLPKGRYQIGLLGQKNALTKYWITI